VPLTTELPAAIDGNDPLNLYLRLFSDCNEVAKHLEQVLDMKIGRLEISSKAEWVVPIYGNKECNRKFQ
jgi:hypothetical protein